MDRVPLDREAIDRLIKLLGLGSARDGERAAAGLKAHEFIKRRGLCWADVIRLPIAAHGGWHAGGHDDRKTDFSHAMSWRTQREFCPRHSERLTTKELGFLDGLRTWRVPLTEKQQAWIDGIHARLRGEAA
jgi:hypothetical protein